MWDLHSAKFARTNSQFFQSESVSLMIGRWQKLSKDFFNKKTKDFDVSKIPDIYDSIQYDITNNQSDLIPEVRRTDAFWSMFDAL